MYCSNCGNKLNEDEKFCSNCGKTVSKIDNNKSSDEKQYINGINNDTLFCIISMILMWGTPAIMGIIKYLNFLGPLISKVAGLSGLFPIAGLILLIYTKVKYPNSKFAKILLVIYIIQVVLSIILIIIVISLCLDTLSKCGEIGNILPILIK